MSSRGLEQFREENQNCEYSTASETAVWGWMPR